MSNSQRARLKNNSQFNWTLLFLATCFLVGVPLKASLAQTLAQTPEKSNEPTLWDDLGPSLSLRSAFWSHDKSYSDRSGYLSDSAWLALRPKEILGTKLFFEGYLTKNDTLRGASILTEAREAYLEKSVGDFDFRAGRQIIVWGRADKVNPTDQWTSKNYTLLATDDEDQRFCDERKLESRKPSHHRTF